MTNFPISDIEHVVQYVFNQNGRSLSYFMGYELDTALQPIFSFAHKRIIGYEALARARDASGYPANSSKLFSPGRQEDSLIFLDRLCRYVHVNNFMKLGDDINWLFLNVCPQVIMHGKRYGAFFSDLLDALQLPPHRVVIEIVEHPIADEALLIDTVHYYKDIGCLVALDDFGVGYSNFERIWLLNPDIIKLDRSMILQATTHHKVHRILPDIVSLFHQAGCLVLVEGVETEQEAMIAMESDADFVQGYFFARPEINFEAFCQLSLPFEKLFETYKEISATEAIRIEKLYHHYSELFQDVVNAVQSSVPLADACARLITEPSVVRCYLLTPNGIQIGHTIVSSTYYDQTDIRFAPLQDAKSADWFRRHYMRKAMVHPEQLQISRPYLSITGGHMCVTLSMMFPTSLGNRIFCCDLNWK